METNQTIHKQKRQMELQQYQNEDILEELYKVNESLDEIRKHTRLFYILAMIGIIASIAGVVVGLIYLVLTFTRCF